VNLMLVARLLLHMQWCWPWHGHLAHTATNASTTQLGVQMNVLCNFMHRETARRMRSSLCCAPAIA
jgi:hypothetical protein